MFRKAPYSQVSEQLDKFFFLPFKENETPDMRAEAIESYLKITGWTWDEVLVAMDNVGKN